MQKRRDERFRDAAEVRRTLRMHVYFQSISIFESEICRRVERNKTNELHIVYLYLEYAREKKRNKLTAEG